MAGKYPLYIVDVFAEKKYAGNQLAVIRNAGTLSDDIMQRIAQETGFSETTFILSDKKENGGYNVRIFTPEEELQFAGHPTLGTAYIIRELIEDGKTDRISLNIKVGQIPVTFIRDDNGEEILWMKQIEPVFGQKFAHKVMSEVLGLDEVEFDGRFPAEAVSTGLPVIIVPLKTLDAVRKTKINKEKYRELIGDNCPCLILVFAPETYASSNHLNVRVLTVFEKIPEDPATGSANGCLAGYLVKHEYFGKEKIDIRVEQGYEIGRPSLLYLRSERAMEKIDVNVGGKVIFILKGELV
ncbi:phenazine biosynthesis protein [Methanocella sp. CWC-04]|uniref:Phenazine biosynthesis protein n=1 Tax=Methanooceanicella nereidis TaxID=2052831 RepID=A0AAP2RCY7_9EURY|nr:PhzF family phenazine biosynthesis protein [Methanocella sp. CWC-04]MCD1295143.1 phenazine biosynthesis protein [Methanocella sp. CWC-04]